MKPAKPLPVPDLELILEHTAPLWEGGRRQRIFLTGGTGFFGAWLVESFCHANRSLDLHARLVLLTRNPDRFAAKCPHLAGDPAVILHRGDVRDFAFPEGEFSHIIHAATETDARLGQEDPLGMFSTIVRGTERVLDFALVRGARKLLFTSSGAVYGKQPPDLTHVPESYCGAPDPMQPASSYGEGKRAAESLCALYTQRSEGRLQCKIARCWAFVGPHLPLDQHFAIGNFIGDALAGRPIAIQGDGTPRRSYLYAADLAIWLWTMLFRAPPLVPFNVGSDRDLSILELARTVAATLNPTLEIRVAREPVAGAPPPRYVPCVDRAREMLGLNETVGLEEAIRRTALWYRGDC